jgi:hypothetical protein
MLVDSNPRINERQDYRGWRMLYPYLRGICWTGNGLSFLLSAPAFLEYTVLVLLFLRICFPFFFLQCPSFQLLLSTMVWRQSQKGALVGRRQSRVDCCSSRFVSKGMTEKERRRQKRVKKSD